MPAIPSSQQPVAVRHRTPSPIKETYPYSTSGMGSNNNHNIDKGGHKQGAPANSTSNRNNSMYSMMSQVLSVKEAWLQEGQKNVEEIVSNIKTKKASHRPLTPHGNRSKNFIERNRQSVQSVPSISPTRQVKKPKEDLKQQKSSATTGTNGQSSVRPKTEKKNDGLSKSRRPISPPASTTQSAHSRSHAHVRETTPSRSGHSAHSRSHVRAESPEKTLREDVRKLKRIVQEREDWLNEKETELMEATDIIDVLQERVKQVEARNRELQQENDIMRNYIEKDLEKKKSSSNEPINLISSLSSNVQRIRGEPVSPTSSKSSSPVSSPVLTNKKSKELLKVNNDLAKINGDPIMISPSLRPRVVPQTRGNLIPVNQVNQQNLTNGNDRHQPKPTAAMDRNELSPFNSSNGDGIKRIDMLNDRQASALDRKNAAVLNVVMEESDDSEVDEFIYDRDDDASDDQADSESNESENDDLGNPSEDDHDDDDYDDGDDESVNEFDSKWSTNASSSKHNLDSIIEEEDEEDEEFKYEQNKITPTPQKNKNNVSGNGQNGQYVNNANSVYSSSQHTTETFRSTQKQMNNKYANRNSMPNNVKSDSISSNDSNISVLSSQNDSYPTSVTPPSSINSSLTKSNNGLYGHSPVVADSSNQSKNDLPKIRSTNNSNNGTPNSVKNPNKHDIDSTSVSKSSYASNGPTSRAQSPNSPSSSRASNGPTSRAQSPSSPSSSRTQTPTSESSRNASGYNHRSQPNEKNSTGSNPSSDKCQTAVPPPSPPPPPANKDAVATLQHYLRLISENSIMENPLKSYDIKKVIDEGSSSKVYNAHPLSNPNEECAIKVVPLTYSLEFIFNEIYVLKNLKHKNIVDFKESFLRWDGKTREVWIAMEKCARGDVTSRAGKINQREVGRIAGDLLNALKHLHSHGVIHRDIKLSNILANTNNEIKLADFGISSLTPTSTTAMVGTIPYMAPDVVLVGPDRPYDTKVDIWSVGVCILELLTGKAAWGRIRDDEIMDKLRKGETPYGFHRLRKKADIGWEAIDFLEKCFIKTPENRWSAEKLLEHPFIVGNRN